MMTRRVFKCWMFNVLMCVVLFISYRILIAVSEPANDSWMETLLHLLGVLLNLGFSAVYLLIMLLGSFAIFLNQSKKVRDNCYLSLLTFVAVPAIGVICLALKLGMDLNSDRHHVLGTLAVFALLYFTLNSLTFLASAKTGAKFKMKHKW